MNPHQWQKAKELFNDARHLSLTERIVFLNENCGDDKKLRREVESLLENSDDILDFLERPVIGEVAEIIANRDIGEPISESFSHYKIISSLGSGGMGDVYLAQDTQLGRRIALKFLPAAFAADIEREGRFKQEARAVSALNHPNIIVIYEIGETENKTLYIATEYIEGETLRGHLNGKGLKLPETLDIAIQIAGALAAAHEAGIVHRDIKPENIMLRPDGYIKVLDFGLVKFLENKLPAGSESSTTAHQETAPGMIMGTVRYMSPEQARGREIDERSDIFSFGALLYEMLAGQSPFGGESNSDVLAALLYKEPLPLVRYLPEGPAEIQHIVGKALRKNKEERYRTMKDVLLDLKDLRDQVQLQVKGKESGNNKTPIEPTQILKAETTRGQQTEYHETNVSGKESFVKPNKNQNYRGMAALVLILVILSAGSVWLVNRWQNRFARITVQKTAQTTDWSGLDDFPSLSPDGNTVAYCSDHNGNFDIYIKSLTPGAREIQLTSDGAQNFQPVFSPNGLYIAYHSKGRGGIWVIPAAGGDSRQLTDFGTHPAWSPDGQKIVFQSYPLNDLGVGARIAMSPSTLWVVSAQGSEPTQLTQFNNPVGGHGAPTFSPDGKHIVFEVDDYNESAVWVMPAGGGEAKLIFKPAYEPAFAADGKSIFFVGGRSQQNGALQLPVNSDTCEPAGEATALGGNVAIPRSIRNVRFSADGKKMTYAELNRSESLATVPLEANSDEANGVPSTLVQKSSGRIHQPAFSPDGGRLAFTSCLLGGAGCDIWLTNIDGSNQVQLTTDGTNEMQASWFPNMDEVAFVTDRKNHWTLWSINLDNKRERILLDLPDDIENGRVSPDGKQITYNSRANGGFVNVWTAPLNGGPSKQLTFSTELDGFPSWSPDGKWIAYQSKRGDDTHVMIIQAAGGMPEQLTFDKGQSWAYSWSPDNDKVLFAGFRNGYWNVWWVSRTTKKEQQLTDYKKLNSFVRYPAWSPLGNQIAYEYTKTTGNIWVADIK